VLQLPSHRFLIDDILSCNSAVMGKLWDADLMQSFNNYISRPAKNFIHEKNRTWNFRQLYWSTNWVLFQISDGFLIWYRSWRWL